MDTNRIPPRIEDINSILGDEVTPRPKMEELRKLRTAQNANRGRPRADSLKVSLHQLNVGCRIEFCNALEGLSLREGKTKRSLMEEALNLLFSKYRMNEL